VHKVEIASEEAAMDDPAFAVETVQAETVQLHHRIVEAWTACDRQRLGALLGPELMVEWRRRLDDFDRKGWHNVTELRSDPHVEYVGIVNREADAEDRVCVRIVAHLHDVVIDRGGQVIQRNDDDDGDIRLAEYWTLGKKDGHWILLSIEQDLEGLHNLDAPIVAAPWSDDRLHDEAVTERAEAAAVPTDQVRAVADVDFDGTARTAALDLATVDGRFAPDVLEAAARRALAGWAEAVDGDDDALEAVATPDAVQELLHPGDRSGRTRLVVRGPELRRLRIVAVDGSADPPSMTVEAEVAGRRYVENRDTTTVVSGSKEHEVVFVERWSMELSDHDGTPWRIARTGAA
jgi:predicted lipid-binding transport protein (Tim44 family)